MIHRKCQSQDHYRQITTACHHTGPTRPSCVLRARIVLRFPRQYQGGYRMIVTYRISRMGSSRGRGSATRPTLSAILLFQIELLYLNWPISSILDLDRPSLPANIELDLFLLADHCACEVSFRCFRDWERFLRWHGEE